MLQSQTTERREMASSLAEQQREEARKFIDKLTSSKGGITEENREFLISHQKWEILESLDSARQSIGATTKA
jgi:hypothetical protein